jgi:hypothetical protein
MGPRHHIEWTKHSTRTQRGTPSRSLPVSLAGGQSRCRNCRHPRALEALALPSPATCMRDSRRSYRKGPARSCGSVCLARAWQALYRIEAHWKTPSDDSPDADVARSMRHGMRNLCFGARGMRWGGCSWSVPTRMTNRGSHSWSLGPTILIFRTTILAWGATLLPSGGRYLPSASRFYRRKL